MPVSAQKKITELILDFRTHPNTLSVLKHPSSPASYGTTIRGAIRLRPGQLLPVPSNSGAFLEDVLRLLQAPNLTSNQVSALRLFHSCLTHPLTIVGVDTPITRPRSVRVPTTVATVPSSNSAVGPVTLTQPLTIARDYMRRQFIERLESQERYYPNLFRKQPAVGKVCLRYPATFFRYRHAPPPIRQAVVETILSATERIVFHVAAPDVANLAAMRAVPFSEVTKLELVPVGSSAAKVLVYCRNDGGTIEQYQLIQRIHGTGAGYEPFCLPATALIEAAAKGPVGSAPFIKSLFTHLSLDHVEPFVDTLRGSIKQLDGLVALTELISQRGGPPLGAPKARKELTLLRPIYRSLCQPDAVPAALVAQVASEIRLLASTIKLEILSTSRNSQRGSNTFD